MEVYKVCRKDKGKLKSAMPRLILQRGKEVFIAQLTYKPGVVTYPKFGKIFAFDNLTNAKNFVAEYYLLNFEIWSASAPKAEPIDIISADIKYLSSSLISRLKAFWLGKDCKKTMPAPKGTVVCPNLKLEKLESC